MLFMVIHNQELEMYEQSVRKVFWQILWWFYRKHSSTRYMGILNAFPFSVALTSPQNGILHKMGECLKMSCTSKSLPIAHAVFCTSVIILLTSGHFKQYDCSALCRREREIAEELIAVYCVVKKYRNGKFTSSVTFSRFFWWHIFLPLSKPSVFFGFVLHGAGEGVERVG